MDRPNLSATIDELIEQRYPRRKVIVAIGGIATAALAAGCEATPQGAHRRSTAAARLSPSREDALRVAEGYRFDVVARAGDALFDDAPSLDAAALRHAVPLRAGGDAQQARQFGTNCDAIAYFPIDGSSSRHGILCVNNEFVSEELAFAGLPVSGRERARGRKSWIEAHPAAVAWMQAAHGVSVFEVGRKLRGWRHVRGGAYARRITATTPCELTGPARGHELLRTAADPSGTRALGTLANCAGGKTPWGTYLSAEENVNDYFGNARSWAEGGGDAATALALQRFLLRERSLYGWEHVDRRFDMRHEPNEALRFGWIVEIDPRDPTAAPRKRTALGRFAHEGANTILARDGRVCAYMGDDEKFEYVYKFVTAGRFDARDPGASRDLLDTGTLYAAKFRADGSGEWLALVHDESGPLSSANGFRSQGDVSIRTRAAADLLGATPMDRPEDVKPNPVTGHVYVALTKNADRRSAPQRRVHIGREIDLAVDAANPRPENDYGHIIEIVESGDDAAATRFSWNIFMLAGNPRQGGGRLLTRYGDLAAGNLSRDDSYFAGFADASRISPIACPDNLGVDPQGRLWIVTDTEDDRLPNNGCFVVPTSGPTRGELRQIASGPLGCEICGCEFTPDGRTLFLSIQHPGRGGSVDAPRSHWPDGGDLPARSAVVAITRADGETL